MAKIEHPAMLLVLDGWGHSDATQYNAIHNAAKPVWDQLWAERPHLLLHCSGLDVGLPDGQMGNSEVGHMHIGAGRVIYQELTRISKAVADGEFARNPTLVAALTRTAAADRALHVLGLLSPGGVHSHEAHAVEILRLAARHGIRRIYVHAFLDGRDVPPKSAATSLRLIATTCRELGVGRIASIIGRYYAMDRNHNWARTETAYTLLVEGHAPYTCEDPMAALDQAYARGETDEFVKATAIHAPQTPPIAVEDGDLVMFTNFRADRTRQLTEAFIRPAFARFTRRRVPRLGGYLTMTDYGDGLATSVLFPPTALLNTFGDVVAAHGLHQLRIAETEKYAHVTFFFNGGRETPFPGEDRVLIPSPAVATYDQQPQMSAVEVTAALVEAIASRRYDAIICNYANADMVGHTGDYAATIRCIETLDACIGRLVAATAQTGMEMLITADHGNAEKMRTVATPTEPSEPHTAHTSNPVPLIYVGRAADAAPSGGLADIAPTLLAIMGLEQPAEMTGRSLVTLREPGRATAARSAMQRRGAPAE